VIRSAATEFVFSAAGQHVSIWDGTSHALIQGQYYWGGKPVGYYQASTTHFQHQDWMGTERTRTTYNGAVEGTFTSLPFGDGLDTTSGTDTDAYHFGMLDHDYATDTEHAQFRQYNSAQGHWMRPDPYSGSYRLRNPQSFNRYAYALNNPLSMVDPIGLEDESGCPDDQTCMDDG
jgi:RHS repeat-associated protein